MIKDSPDKWNGLKPHTARKHTNYAENYVPIKSKICKIYTKKDMKYHMISCSFDKSDFLMW